MKLYTHTLLHFNGARTAEPFPQVLVGVTGRHRAVACVPLMGGPPVPSEAARVPLPLRVGGQRLQQEHCVVAVVGQIAGAFGWVEVLGCAASPPRSACPGKQKPWSAFKTVQIPIQNGSVVERTIGQAGGTVLAAWLVEASDDLPAVRSPYLLAVVLVMGAQGQGVTNQRPENRTL